MAKVFDLEATLAVQVGERRKTSKPVGDGCLPRNSVGSATTSSGSVARVSRNSLGSATTTSGSLARASSVDSLDMESKLDGCVNSVPASAALLGLGRMFRDTSSDFSRHRRQVEHIDDFWSYSRQAPAWLDLSILLVHYNGLPSTVAGCLAALAGACLLPHDWAPAYQIFGFVTLSLGLVTAGLVLLVWCSRRQVFIDRACISQDDIEEKRLGIMSLGYFLKNSRAMLAIWDPTYFTRLWCVFEIAAYLKLKDEGHTKNKLKVLPAIHGAIVAVSLVLVVLTLLSTRALAMLSVEEDAMEDPMEMLKCVIKVTLGLMPPLALAIRPLLKFHFMFADQQRQLSEFSVRNADCYCCSVAHMDPVSNESIPCDRVLVESSINLWFGGLDAFDTYVRKELREKVHLKAYFPLRYIIMTFGTLFLWQALGESAWLLKSGNRSFALTNFFWVVSAGGIYAPIVWSCLHRVIDHYFRVDSSLTAAEHCKCVLIMTAAGGSVYAFGSFTPLFLGTYGWLLVALVLCSAIFIMYRHRW